MNSKIQDMSCSSDCKRAHTSKVLLAHLKRKQKFKNEVSLLQPPPDCLEVIKVIQNVVPGTQGDHGQNTSMCAQAGGYGFLASLWIASLFIMQCCCRGFCEMWEPAGFFNGGFCHPAARNIWNHANICTKWELALGSGYKHSKIQLSTCVLMFSSLLLSYMYS